MPRTVLKVCGGGWWWLRPILVFSLSLDQAEQHAFHNVLSINSWLCEPKSQLARAVSVAVSWPSVGRSTGNVVSGHYFCLIIFFFPVSLPPFIFFSVVYFSQRRRAHGFFIQYDIAGGERVLGISFKYFSKRT